MQVVAPTLAGVRVRPSDLWAQRQVVRQRRVREHLTRAGRRFGATSDYAGSRAYMDGDDVRTIEPRATARTGVLHTQLLQQVDHRPVHLVLDLSPEMCEGHTHTNKAVCASQIAAQMLWLAVAAQAPCSLHVLYGDQPRLRVDCAPKAADAQRALRQLAQAVNARLDAVLAAADGGRAGDTALADALLQQMRIAIASAELASVRLLGSFGWLADASPAAETAFVRLAARAAHLGVVCLCTELEMAWSRVAADGVGAAGAPQQMPVMGAGGAVLLADLSAPRFLARWHAHWQAVRATLQRVAPQQYQQVVVRRRLTWSL